MLSVKTGDIVLFSGKGVIPTIIKILTFSKWSHVGMVIIDDKYDFPLLYESTHDNTIRGLDNDKFNTGVQCVPLHKRIETYNGKVALRRLHNTDFTKTRHKLKAMRKKFVGTPFEINKIELLSSVRWLKFLRTKGSLDHQFCSENTAQGHIELGVLDPEIPSSHYSPAWYARNSVLFNGAYFGQIEELNKVKE